MGKKVNQTELAVILGVTDVTIWEWQKAGMPVLFHGERGHANQYDTSAVIAWKLEIEIQKVRKESPRDALYLSQRKLVEIQVAEKERALLSAADITRELSRMVMVARQQLLQLPGLLPLDEQQRVLMAQAIEATLKELSNYEPGADPDAQGGAPVGPADPPVGGIVGGGETLPE